MGYESRKVCPACFNHGREDLVDITKSYGKFCHGCEKVVDEALLVVRASGKSWQQIREPPYKAHHGKFKLCCRWKTDGKCKFQGCTFAHGQLELQHWMGAPLPKKAPSKEEAGGTSLSFLTNEIKEILASCSRDKDGNVLGSVVPINYKKRNGERLDYKSFGFDNFKQMIASMPQVATTLQAGGGHLLLCPTPSNRQHQLQHQHQPSSHASGFVSAPQKHPKRQHRSSNHKIFVGGVSLYTTDEDFHDCFEEYGEIADFVIMKTPGGKPRGFGFVSYLDNASVERAIAGRPYLDGRELDIKKAVPGGLPKEYPPPPSSETRQDSSKARQPPQYSSPPSHTMQAAANPKPRPAKPAQAFKHFPQEQKVAVNSPPPAYSDVQRDSVNQNTIAHVLGEKLTKYIRAVSRDFDIYSLRQIKTDAERTQFLEYVDINMTFPDIMAFKAMFQRLHAP